MYAYDDEDDGFLNNMVEGPGQSSGCTAVVALLAGRELYVANAGDSRCVLCRNGKTVEMSFDHKPEDEEESLRITNAGMQALAFTLLVVSIKIDFNVYDRWTSNNGWTCEWRIEFIESHW